MSAGREKLAALAQTAAAAALILERAAALKFNPDQPREPAGTPEGGQWSGGNGGGGPKVEGGDSVKAAARALPAAHREALKETTVREADSIDFFGRQVAGYALGQSVRVARRVDGRETDIQGVTIHELGHALDNLKGERLSERLGPGIRAEASKLPARARKAAEHFLQSNSEMFAEAYRLAHSPSGKGAFAMSQRRAERAFKSSIAAIRALNLDDF